MAKELDLNKLNKITRQIEIARSNFNNALKEVKAYDLWRQFPDAIKISYECKKCKKKTMEFVGNNATCSSCGASIAHFKDIVLRSIERIGSFPTPILPYIFVEDRNSADLMRYFAELKAYYQKIDSKLAKSARKKGNPVYSTLGYLIRLIEDLEKEC